ncbi:MAG: hypothetical protein DI551_09715, partial [Micavibrio aeruginosavorus]
MNVKTSMLILFVLLGVVLFVPGAKNNACAQAAASGAIAQQTCDTQVWQTMEARARLETEREIMQNQNLIFKADSILNYTCFDSFAAHASANIGVLFTHTTYFGGAEIIPWGEPWGVDFAMDNVVYKSMDPYLTGNFDRGQAATVGSYLGGRGQHLGLAAPEINPVGSRGRTYACNVMNEVWRAAKCMNFLHVQQFNLDGFFPFINLAPTEGGTAVAGYETHNDIRQFPTPCANSTPITGSTWLDMFRRSRNETAFGTGDPLYAYHVPLNVAFTQIREKLEPGACGPAILTGVQVIRGVGSTGDKYDDGVCTNPGCVFQKGGTCAAPAGGTVAGAAAAATATTL